MMKMNKKNNFHSKKNAINLENIVLGNKKAFLKDL
jgi:hypothetical protein